MRFRTNLSGALFGAALLLLGSASQAAVVTAAADFDLSSLSVSSTGGIASITPAYYSAFAETPNLSESNEDVEPVSSIADDSYSTGAAVVMSDAAEMDSGFLNVVASAFDGGFGLGMAGIEIAYEIIDDGDVTISVDYSALYDLDGSMTAEALVSLTVDDSLSGALDDFELLSGDPEFAFGTLNIEFFALAGDVGSVFLSATAGVDTGISQVPVPNVLLLMGAGFIGLLSLRNRIA